MFWSALPRCKMKSREKFASLGVICFLIVWLLGGVFLSLLLQRINKLNHCSFIEEILDNLGIKTRTKTIKSQSWGIASWKKIQVLINSK